MRTFIEKKQGKDRVRRRALAAVLRRSKRCAASGEDGFLLIEVIVSAMLVAIIVIGTFSGFDVINRSTAEERHHEQAALLAAASQEQLRSDPASALQSLQSSPHVYTQTVEGTIYKITQGAELEPAAGSGSACQAGSSTRQSGNAYRITSTVAWHTQEATKRPAVVASSLITPPIGSSLEVDILAAPASTEGVAGLTGNVKYTPEGTTGTATQTQTTGSEGCLLFGAIPSYEAEIEIAEALGYVTIDGKSKLPIKHETLAPNYTSHYTAYYNRGGALQAKFEYSGAATANHKNNAGTAEVAQTVAGDTFVALNTGMEQTPNFELGSTSYGSSAVVPYEVNTGTLQASATSKSNLFPFTETESAWGVYAGDCTANEPKAVTGGAVEPAKKVFVKPGATTSVSVPTSYTTLNVYTEKESKVAARGSKAWEALETTNAYPVLIDNLGCTAVTPVDEKEVSYKHAQTTTTGSSIGGHLGNPFQPFGKEFSLCLVSAAKNQTYKVKYANMALAGGTVSIYLPQRPPATVSAERIEEESLWKTEEAAYKSAETNYKAKETAYKAKQTAYKAQESKKNREVEATAKETAYNGKKTEYNGKKTEYNNKVTQYNSKKTEYNNKVTQYTNKLAEYNKTSAQGGKKTSQKTEYETFKTEYETFKTEYETFKTEYEKFKTEYLKFETEYEKFKTEYLKFETEYEEYAKPKAEYEALLAEYQTYKTSYEKSKANYEAAHKEWETLKAEEKEGASVTVESGTTCT
jgi:Tfp pilus assembly protein PilV